MIDLPALVAQHMQSLHAPIRMTAPKQQPNRHAVKLETFQKPDGTWGLRAVKIAPGRAKAPVTKVTYTPYP